MYRYYSSQKALQPPMPQRIPEVQGIQCIGTAERCSETDPRWFRVDTWGVGMWVGLVRRFRLGGKDDTRKIMASQLPTSASKDATMILLCHNLRTCFCMPCGSHCVWYFAFLRRRNHLAFLYRELARHNYGDNLNPQQFLTVAIGVVLSLKGKKCFALQDYVTASRLKCKAAK